jgi:hypothetical protein
MKTVKKIVGVAIWICVTLVGCKDDKELDPVKIPTGEIPDMMFRDYLLRNFDTDLDGFISIDEATMVKEIDLSNNENITSLKGIEYLTSLEKLYIRNLYGLEELDLSSNLELSILDCSEIHGLNLNISQNTKLKELYCENIRCTTLSLSNKTALQVLHCSNNPLETIDLRNCTELEVLDCRATLATVDFSNNKRLKYVNLINTTRSLNLIEFQQLEELYLASDETEDLVIRNIPLKKFSYTGRSNLTISDLPDLESLSIQINWEGDQTLDLTKSTKLKYLYCARLNCNVDISNCKELEWFSWHFPRLAEHTIDISNNKALKILQFFTRTGRISSFKNSSLTDAWIYAKDKEHYDFSGSTHLKQLLLEGERYSADHYDIQASVDFTDCADLDSVVISALGMTSLDITAQAIGQNSKLKTVVIRDCDSLAIINAAGLQHLESFNLTSNSSFTTPAPIEADFSHCINLKSLILRNKDNIKSLNLIGCTSLRGWTEYPR